MVRILSSKRGGGMRSSAVARPGIADARLKLIKKHRSEISDARDMLVKMAKTTDARQKLEKIRNLKAGKLEVKKTAKGNITITTTTKGNVLLTTKKKESSSSRKFKTKVEAGATRVGRRAAAEAAASTRSGNLTRRVGRGGTLSISTRKSGTAIRSPPGPRGAVSSSRSAGRSGSGAVTKQKVVVRDKAPAKPLTRTIKGTMSAAAKLDEELLNTHVDPLIMKRTIKQSVRPRSPQPRRYVPTRTMSPDRQDLFDGGRRVRSNLEYDSRHSARRGYNDYDRPSEREDELYRRKLMRQNEGPVYTSRTMADRLDSGSTYASNISPLQGAKIIVGNLQDSVSQEDIMELFGGVGPLKRAKLVEIGTAEVVFVNRSDALKAVEIYHNRQLDGKAMKCQVVGAGAGSPSTGFKLPSSYAKFPSDSAMDLHPEMDAVHRALFSEKRRVTDRSGSTKPLFTAT